MPKATKSSSAAAKAPAKKITAKAPPAKAASASKPAPAKKAAVKAAPTKAAPPAAKVVAAPKPAPAKKPAPRSAALEKFYEGQRKLLLEEREVYTRQATTLRAEADQLAQDRDPGDVQFDEESGQGDSMNVERERDLALSAQALASVDEIDRSLEKMVAGTYGVCEKCGETIPRERMKALPFASLCVTCKSGGLSRR
jgi:DnaK suppressor protein